MNYIENKYYNIAQYCIIVCILQKKPTQATMKNTEPKLELVDCEICFDLRSVVVEENYEGGDVCCDCYAANPKLLRELIKNETNKNK